MKNYEEWLTDYREGKSRADNDWYPNQVDIFKGGQQTVKSELDELKNRLDAALERAGQACIGTPMFFKQFDDVIGILRGDKKVGKPEPKLYWNIENPSKTLKAGDLVVIDESQRVWKIDTCNSNGFHATTIDEPTRCNIVVYASGRKVRAAHSEEIKTGRTYD